MYISIDKNGNLMGVSSYKFYSNCIEVPDQPHTNMKYNKKLKKLVKIKGVKNDKISAT